MEQHEKLTRFKQLQWKEETQSFYTTSIEISPRFTRFKAYVKPDTSVNMDISNDIDGHYLEYSYENIKNNSVMDSFVFGTEYYPNAEDAKKAAQAVFEKICCDIVLSIID